MRFLNNNRYFLRVLIIFYTALSFPPRAHYLFAIKLFAIKLKRLL